MYETPLREVMFKNKDRLVKAAPQMCVGDAARAMARVGAGAVLAVDDGGLRGIFTERDAVYRVVARGLDPEATPLAQVTTPSPRTLGLEQPFGTALALMHKQGFHHVPVVQDGQPLRIVFARNALDPEMEDFVAESRRRDRFAIAD
ncbi:MAG: cyclic nucleotide-binding/CBS domain-containing protein [Betaproteobacteria bacterium]